MADIDFKNSVNADTAYVEGHKVKLIAVPDGTLELPISATSDSGYVVDTNGKKHRVLLATFLTGDPDYKSSATEDTAYMTIDGQKVKVNLGAKLNGTQYLSNSANVNDGYTEDDDGNKHRTMLVATPTGTLELPTSETDDSAYVIDDNGDKHKVRLFILLAGGTTTKEVTISGIPPLYLLGAVEDSLSELKAFGGTALDNIPQEYTQIEYVERPSGGTEQYIETNWKPNLAKDIRIQGTATYMGTITNYRPILLGNYTGIRSSTLNIDFDGRTQNNLRIYTLKTNASSGNDLQVGPFATNAVVDFDIQITGSTGALAVSVTAGGTTETGSGTIENVGEQTLYNMMLFKDHRATMTSASKVASRIHYLKATEDGNVVFELIPVKRKSDSVVGLYDKVSGQFLTNQGTGSFTAGNEVLPTPTENFDIYCNNGKISVLDHTNWNVITNPTSQTGKGMFISTDGKLQKANDRGAGVFIPVTVGKQYTLLINKKTTALGSIIRYGQSNNGDLPNSAEQLLDWYRGNISDGMMISFTAKRPYFVMQLGADFVEAGGIDEAVEVIESAGGDYTFLEYLVADGDSWIETNLSGAARWVGAGQATSESTGSKCILGALTSSGNASVYLASRFGSSSDARNKRWTIDGAAGATSVSGLTYAKYDIDYQENTFTGTINAESTSRTNTDTFTTWFIGSSRGISGGVTTNYPFVGNIYRQQAYQNNVLVGDFIPAIRNSDNVVGMYDTVSGTFYTNAGTGDFTAGTVVSAGEVLSMLPSGQMASVSNLFKLNDYQDVQEIITGATTHKVGVRVLDGTENWGVASSSGNRVFGTNLIGASPYPLICTHFVNGEPTTDNIIYITSGTAILWIRYDTPSNLVAFKSWLAAQYAAGTPVIVLYPLATEYEEPAPIAQSMTVVDGDNTVSLTQQGMTPLTLEATYTAGVSVTITEIENANIGNDVDVVIA